MGDYGISKYIPDFAKNFPEKVTELEKYLEDHLGVPKECSLQDVTLEDLLESKLLKKPAARKLIQGWQNSANHDTKPANHSNIQIGGSRNKYYDSVDESQHHTVQGDYAQIYGNRTVKHETLTQSGGAGSQFGGAYSQVGGAGSSFGGAHSQFGGSQNAPNIDIRGNAVKSHFGQGNQYHYAS